MKAITVRSPNAGLAAFGNIGSLAPPDEERQVEEGDLIILEVGRYVELPGVRRVAIRYHADDGGSPLISVSA